MVARTIIKWPDPRLLKTSADVDPVDSAVLSLALDLYHTMVVSYGAGIAAPQIGVQKNVCVVSANYVPSLPIEEKMNQEGNCVVLVNPRLEFLDNQKFKWEESCLSVPDLTSSIVRHQKLRLRYYNLSGELIEKVLEDIESATIQHETDHLIGKLFIHRLSGLNRQIAMRKLRRRILNQKRQSKQSEAENREGTSKMSASRRQALRAKRKKKNKARSKSKR